MKIAAEDFIRNADALTEDKSSSNPENIIERQETYTLFNHVPNPAR